MSSASLVLYCKNKHNNENIITGLDLLNENTKIVFYPSVTKNKYLELEANSGAVLSITTSAGSISNAVERLYDEVKEVSFNSMTYRKDIAKLKI